MEDPSVRRAHLLIPERQSEEFFDRNNSIWCFVAKKYVIQSGVAARLVVSVSDLWCAPSGPRPEKDNADGEKSPSRGSIKVVS